MKFLQLSGAFLTLLLTASLSEGLFATKSFAQWIPQSSGTTEQLNDVAMINSTTAIVVGNNATILKTTNSGAVWMPRPIGTTHDLRSVAFFFGQGYAVGYNVICYSSDEGETWSIDSSAYDFAVVDYGVFFNSSVYIGAESGIVLYKPTGSSSWEERLLQGGSIVGIGLQYGALQSTNAFVATSEYAYHIFEGGSLGWDSTSLPRLVGDTPTGGDLRNPAQYIVGYSGNPEPIPYLLRRADPFDTTWQRFTLPPLFFPNDVKASWQGDKISICGSKRTIYQSVDSGATWTLQYGNIGDYFPALRAMAFRDDTLGYAVGDSGLILFTSNGGTTSINESTNRPRTYALLQNYPNPFNLGTVISYMLPVSSRTSLKVYSLLGQEVATLVNEIQSAGEHKVSFDALHLASGVYFYRLSTQDFVASKKLILIK